MGVIDITGDTTGTIDADDTGTITGDLDSDADGPGTPTWSISDPADFGVATVDATGNWTYDLDESNAAVQALEFGDSLTDTFTVQAVDGLDLGTEEITITIEGVCFVAGTLIDTAKGPRPVEELCPGDLIRTVDRGFQPLRWVGRMSVARDQMMANPKLRPVCIRAGALGRGRPTQDLYVSRQHRVLVRLAPTEAGGERTEALVPAIKLVGRKGIEQDSRFRDLTYYHLLFDRHEVVFSNGAPSESLLPGPVARDALPLTALEEVRALFPEILEKASTPARAIPRRDGEMRRALETLDLK